MTFPHSYLTALLIVVVFGLLCVAAGLSWTDYITGVLLVATVPLMVAGILWAIDKLLDH